MSNAAAKQEALRPISQLPRDLKQLRGREDYGIRKLTELARDAKIPVFKAGFHWVYYGSDLEAIDAALPARLPAL
jgi:hypothetical protein